MGQNKIKEKVHISSLALC